MLQLIECGARDHPTNIGKATVRADALSTMRRPQPEPSAALLDARGKSAIINDLSADRRKSACRLQRRGTDKHAATRCSGSRATRINNPCRRIKLEEEEHKRRDQKFFRQGSAIELHHVRNEIIRTRSRELNKL